MDFEAVRRKHDDDETRCKTKNKAVRPQVEEFAAYIKKNLKAEYSVKPYDFSDWNTTFVIESPEETKKGYDPTYFGYSGIGEYFTYNTHVRSRYEDFVDIAMQFLRFKFK
jgi:hypothetical protein